MGWSRQRVTCQRDRNGATLAPQMHVCATQLADQVAPATYQLSTAGTGLLHHSARTPPGTAKGRGRMRRRFSKLLLAAALALDAFSFAPTTSYRQTFAIDQGQP